MIFFLIYYYLRLIQAATTQSILRLDNDKLFNDLAKETEKITTSSPLSSSTEALQMRQETQLTAAAANTTTNATHDDIIVYTEEELIRKVRQDLIGNKQIDPNRIGLKKH